MYTFKTTLSPLCNYPIHYVGILKMRMYVAVSKYAGTQNLYYVNGQPAWVGKTVGEGCHLNLQWEGNKG